MEDFVLGPQPKHARTGPWIRWENEVVKNCSKQGVRDWKAAAQNREQWSTLAVEL